jgi:endoglucanase
MKRSIAVGTAALLFTTMLPAGTVHAQTQPRKESLDFLKRMLENPSPSGYETPVQKLWIEYTGAFAEKATIDIKGNAIGVVNGKGSPRVMFAGHCDEIGFVVRYIDDKGFLSFGAVGGFDEPIIPGRRVVVHTAGGPVQGVIGKPPIHLMKSEDRGKGASIDNLSIDIGAKDKKEAESLVTLGDPVTFPYEFVELRNGLCMARAFDDRVGSFIVAEALRALAGSKGLKVAVYGVSTVQEEIGAAGARTSAFGIDPLVGIAVDVTHAADQPGVERKEVGDVVLGGGPVITRGAYVNPKVFALLVECAKKRNIPYQIDVSPSRTGTDADVIYINRSGVAAGVVSIPLRYMHTPVETLSLADVENTIRLLAAFAEAITPEMTFVP